MTGRRADPGALGESLGRHWDDAYAGGDETASWTQERPARSLAAIAACDPAPDAPILDVGGGSSPLAAALLEAGHTDVTVLDLSAQALDLARARLGARARDVRWIGADLLTWTPPRRYAIWHDRAVLHFFTGEDERSAYAERVRAALAPGGHVVIATFAPDGPTSCSGLPVRRSSPGEVLELLGDEFSLVRAEREEHRTPGGRVQPFAWLVARRTTG